MGPDIKMCTAFITKRLDGGCGAHGHTHGRSEVDSFIYRPRPGHDVVVDMFKCITGATEAFSGLSDRPHADFIPAHGCARAAAPLPSAPGQSHAQAPCACDCEDGVSIGSSARAGQCFPTQDQVAARRVVKRRRPLQEHAPALPARLAIASGLHRHR